MQNLFSDYVKHGFACVVLACVAAAPFAAFGQNQKQRQPVVLDRIVAVVNDEAITARELDERAQIALKQLAQQGTSPPPRPVVERQLLERMIADRVQVQFAKESGMRIEDAELDRAIGRIAEQNKLSPQALREALERDGVPYAKFREDIRSEIVMARLREREVDNKMVITESEIDTFLANEQQDGRGDEVDLSHILVVVPERASPEQVQGRRARAEEALGQLVKGTDFRQVAAAYSEAPDALQGGSMGWRPGDRLPTIFHDALKSMKPGDVSAVLRSANGFHILKLNDRRGGPVPASVQQTHVRHILLKTNELISENEARNRLRILKERLENKADFAELARVHSEDASASRGGDLGWILPGDTVPEFERVMNNLQPGQISDPVQTPFGWHLIQVVERGSQDVSKERRRLLARQTLRARKSDEAYQEWVRQLRDRAYVEVRLDER
ncbi:MAG: PpiC-type peptidyl-prolyl cis-trans isomerase [Betaproteobacteria bacterium]|jgi:peptidyl-prolyl cis-trans isomerase SurA|nr:PpiC-type peptidyl-prolyl cis-trans isomerase [Betaproteobacteria bacterium]MEA3153613.1 peptidyl-prolyl cis-trans isomerase SurA [Betaproteobacteria bacterium]